MPDLTLDGCRSRPLAGYLKTLGITRVLSHQLDGEVRVRWNHDTFEVSSDLDADGLRSFWLDHYVPTPVLSPWNGGSGFYPRGNTTAVENLTTIEGSTDQRLEPYRELIALTRGLLAGDTKPEGAAKERLIRQLRRVWPDDALAWLDASVVQAGDSLTYPPVLGSGGNDGRFDFSSNYMAAIAVTVLDRKRSLPLLDAALFAADVPIARTILAHFERDDSPVKAPTPDAPSLGNPWDLVLAIEGTLALSPVAARRLGSAHRGTLVAPFTVRPTAAGYGSAVDGESGRAELWLPLWSSWATYSELSMLIREARAEVRSGSRPRTAATGLDLARAASDLGVARGISAFERYALLERAGQSTLAVPAGRITVAERPAARALRSIDPWLIRLQSFTASDQCPRAVATAGRKLERALFAVAERGSPADACAALEALGAVEQALARSARAAQSYGIRPVFGADADAWIGAAYDETIEFSVAAALASLADPPRARRSPALRDYLHGTREGGAAFDETRRHAVTGSRLVDRLAAIHSRRHLAVLRRSASEDGDTRYEHPAYVWGARCPLPLIERFLTGGPLVDDERIHRLLLGLSVLERTRLSVLKVPDLDGAAPFPAFRLLALAWANPRSLLREQEIAKYQVGHLGPRPGWAAKLQAGRPQAVIGEATRRLRLAGLVPRPHADDLNLAALDGKRLSAALLMVVHPSDLWTIRRQLIEPRANDPQDNREDET